MPTVETTSQVLSLLNEAKEQRPYHMEANRQRDLRLGNEDGVPMLGLAQPSLCISLRS